MKFSPSLTLSRKAMILVAVPLVFELAFVGTLTYLVYQVDSERAREAHARELAAHLNTLLRLLLQRSMANAAYHILDNPYAHKRFGETGKELRAESDILVELTKNDEHEKRVIAQALGIIYGGAGEVKRVGDLMDQGDRIEAAKAAIKIQKGLDELLHLIETFINEQQTLQTQRKEILAQKRQALQYLLYAGVALNIIIAVGLAAYFNRTSSRRLQVLMDNIGHLASDQPLKPPVGGSDEIAKLDDFFRTMTQTLNETRRKERSIVENALAIICSIDAEGRFTQINPACLTIWGREPSELVGQPLTSIVADDDIEGTKRSLKLVMEEGSQVKFENRVIRKDWTICDVRWAVQWSPQEQSLFCVAQDVSAEKEIERMKRDFVAMVNHDLKTPLMSIEITLQLIDQNLYGELNEAGHKHVMQAERSITRLMKLIRELLDIERLESGQHDLEIAPTSVTGILVPAVETVEDLAESEHVKLTIAEHDDTSVDCDRDRIVQVVVNLISNAVKFSPPETTVTVSAKLVDDNWAEISIQDEGRGIPREQQEAIFDRFRQVSKDDARVKGGSGLGLAICKTIVERHHGTIGVESEEGKGSRFWFKLPKSAATTPTTKPAGERKEVTAEDA